MPKQYPSEVRDRALRMTLNRLSDYPSVSAACRALAPKLGVGPETLCRRVVQAQIGAGEKAGPSSEELEEIKRLRAEGVSRLVLYLVASSLIRVPALSSAASCVACSVLSWVKRRG